jgi:hypothetical protein
MGRNRRYSSSLWVGIALGITLAGLARLHPGADAITSKLILAAIVAVFVLMFVRRIQGKSVTGASEVTVATNMRSDDIRIDNPARRAGRLAIATTSGMMACVSGLTVLISLEKPGSATLLGCAGLVFFGACSVYALKASRL